MLEPLNTLLGTLPHCWERSHIVGSAATMCFGPETMLGRSQHCFWSYHNVSGFPKLRQPFPAVRREVFQCGGASFHGKTLPTKDTEVFPLKI